MPDIKRQIKLITRQHIIDEPSGMEGYPMRAWNIEVWCLDDNGDQVPATIFDKVTYKLHPTFPKSVQTFKKTPFRIEEKGWGEFDMSIVLTLKDKQGEHTIAHDLNFQSGEIYESAQTLTFRNPKPELMGLLQEAGLAGEENGTKGKRDEAPRKRNRKDKMVDMEKLGDGLQKLGEDDLLQVVQLIHDHKTSDTYTKNDIENGEFHVDLYTLPDNLVKLLWDFTAERTAL